MSESKKEILDQWFAGKLKTAEFQRRVLELPSKNIVENVNFSSMTEPNPCSMKRLVTAYGLWRAKDILNGGYIEDNKLAQWVIITLRWPLVAYFLEENPDIADIIIESESKESSSRKKKDVEKTSLGAILSELSISKNMKEMLLDPVVCSVLLGKSVGAPLDGNTIKTLVSL